MSLFDPIILNKLDLLKDSVGSGGSGGSLVNASLQVQGNVTANQPIYYELGLGITGNKPVSLVNNRFFFTEVAPGPTADMNAVIPVTYTTVSDLQWVDNGNYLVTCDRTWNGITTATASTPYDISTLFYTSGNGSTSTSFFTNIRGFTWSPDGLTLSTLSNNGLYSFSVSTPFRYGGLTSLGNIGVSSFNRAIEFPADGTHLLLTDDEDINQYAVSTPYRAHTYTGGVQKTLNVGAIVTSVRYTPNGYQLLVTTAGTIIVYNLATPYDIDTAVLVSTIPTTQTLSGVTIDPSATLLTSDTNSGIAQSYVNSSPPGDLIGYSLDTQTAPGSANLILTTEGAIDYAGAAIGDILNIDSDTSSIGLNGTGDLRGYALEVDKIYTVPASVTTFTSLLPKSITATFAITTSTTTSSIGTVVGKGLLKELQIQSIGPGNSVIDQVLINGVVVAVNQRIRLDQTGSAYTTLTVPFDYEFTENTTVQITHTSSANGGTLYCTLYYKSL